MTSTRRGTLRFAVMAAIQLASSAFAQTIEGMGEGAPGETRNQRLVAERRATLQGSQASAGAARPNIVVAKGDSVIAQFVDGAFWQTSITVVNLETHPTTFQVLFVKDDGMDFSVPIVGLSGMNGPQIGVTISLNALGSTTFQTAGTSTTLGQGWAFLLPTVPNDSVGISAIFRLSLPGQQPQEAVVPAANQYATHFVLSYDNTSFVTGIAFANYNFQPANVTAAIHIDEGSILETQTLTVPTFGHVAFVLPAKWRDTTQLRGNIEFTTDVGVAALGLRFNGSAFTSLTPIQNPSWVK